MRFVAKLAVTLGVLVPMVAQSGDWSACQTVNGVSNYLAYSNAVIVSLSPGLPGCAPAGIPGAVIFSVNQNGVTSANVSSFLASALTAYTSGHQVMIFYDNSTGTCQGVIVSVGGYAGQCP